MKLLLLHGAAIKASRKKLLEEKGKLDPNSVMVFDSGSNMEEVGGALMTPSLFVDEQLFVLENPPEDFTNYTLYPKSESSQAPLIPYTLIFWFDHEIGEKKPIMEWVQKKGGQIMFFPESKEISVFPFLDYLAAKDKKAFTEMDKLKKAGYDVHYLTTMVFYLLRNLVATPKGAPQFVKDKLQRQRKNFSPDQLTKLYKNILGFDFKLKSGLLEKEQAEFLLVNLFTHQI